MEGVSSGAHIQNFFAALGDFPKLAALSFMMFNLFVPPCMVAIAVTFREMGSQKWGWFAIGFQLFVGYVLALSVYRLGVLFAGGGFGIWTAVAILGVYRLGVLFAGGGFGIWTAVAILADLFCLWMIVRKGSGK